VPTDAARVQELLLDGVRQALAAVDPTSTARLVERILASKRIFVYGAGRSGFVARCFTMRLNHLGLPIVRMSIDPTTPPSAADCAVIISGTGETPSSIDYANLAHAGGAPVFALTAARTSRLVGTGAEPIVLEVPRSEEHRKVAPLGTIFEEAALLYLDSLVALLMERLQQSEGDMRRRHGVTR
jgi:6-phospho-3-hexuloisomerase